MNSEKNIQNSQKGFAMTIILGFIVIIGILGTAIVQNTVQTNGSAVLHSQVQISHIASKAAIDFAEEQYELNSSYDGTAEQDLFVNDFYRATIEVVILYDQSSSSKRVQGIGRVYIPETSSEAKVVRDIKSTIIRNGEVIVVAGETDPATFSPILWLDANAPQSLYKSATTNTQTIVSLYGAGSADVVEEKGSDASSNPGSLIFDNDDLEMSRDGNNNGNQTTGLRFRGVTTPKSATVSNAYIQFTTDETKSAGVVQLTVQGIASDNPSGWSGTYSVRNAPKTTATINWVPANWNSVGAKGANERLDVTAIVQELVNRSGWNPGNSMAFSIKWVTGSGVRTAEKGQNGSSPELFIQWAGAPAGYSTADGDNVDQWYDISGNSRTANFVYGTRPILKLNQVNGKNAVRFSSNGALMSSFSNLSGTELVAFMVMLPRTTSSSDARFLSIMNSSQNNDDNTVNGLIPFMKSSASTTIQQLYNSTTGRTISGAINGSWATYASRMSTAYSERLLKNSSPDNYGSSFSPNFTINQIYIGGRRSTASGANYADMDVAEVIVYNRAFVCSEIQEIENYLESKYAFSYADKSPCP